MLTIIRNALLAEKETVEVPFSSIKHEIAKILVKQGLVVACEKKGKKVKSCIEITLKYEDGLPAILGLKRVSRPGQRIYTDSKRIKKVKGGYGLSIISTPRGLMTGEEARRAKLGGEIICEIS